MAAGRNRLDLAIDLTRSSGRAARPVSCEIVRELNAADLALLETEQGIKPNPIKRLRDSHHSLARLVAQGLSGHEMSVITGYSQSRISILKADPAFSELVAFYKANLERIRDELAADGIAKLTALFNDAVEEMHDRILDTPEVLSMDQLGDTAKFAADRIGLGPASKSTSVNINLDYAEQVAAGRRRAVQLSAAPPDAPGQRQITPPVGRSEDKS